MGTFIKYLIYIAIIVAAFCILKGLWDGEMNNETEVVEVGVVTPETPTQPQQPTQNAQ